eukprot:8353800-Alexandrium_andersonii.AAC.1
MPDPPAIGGSGEAATVATSAGAGEASEGGEIVGVEAGSGECCASSRSTPAKLGSLSAICDAS